MKQRYVYLEYDPFCDDFDVCNYRGEWIESICISEAKKYTNINIEELKKSKKRVKYKINFEKQ